MQSRFVVPIGRQLKLAPDSVAPSGTKMRREHSVFRLKMYRSMTAMLPCWPMAPYRGGLMPLHLTHRRKASQSKMLSRSQTMHFGIAPARPAARPKKVHMSLQLGRLAKTPIPIARREV